MFLSSLTWSGLQIKDLLDYKIWNISPWFRVLCCVSPGMTMEMECGLQYALKLLKQ